MAQPCRFYRSGYCKFGDRCRYAHDDRRSYHDNSWGRGQNRYAVLGDEARGDGGRAYQNRYENRGGGGGGGGGGGYHQGHYQGGYDQRWSSTKQNSRYHWSAGPKQTEMREIETTLRTDMTDWDSSIWPLSSYSYERYKPCIGDFEEMCFEEVRWEAYKAKATGTLLAYEQSLKQLIQANGMERHSVKRMERKIKEQIEAIMSGSYKQSQPAAVSSGILPGGSLPQQGILAQQAANNPFAVQTNPGNPISPPGLGIFESRSTGVNPANTVNSVSLQIGLNSGTFSQKSEALTPVQETHSVSSISAADLEQFKSNKFTLGSVPESAPPPELC